jgi:hypothetical protein
MREYKHQERILYGAGQTVPTARGQERSARPEVAFIHVRSITNKRFRCRTECASEQRLTDDRRPQQLDAWSVVNRRLSEYGLLLTACCLLSTVHRC